MSRLRLKAQSFAAVAAGISVALVLYAALTPLWGLNEVTNWSLNLIPRDKPAEPVVVCIDDASLRQYGPWPWPRRVLAQLVERIGTQHPKAVGLDILLTEPTPDDPWLGKALRKSGVVYLADYSNLRSRTVWGDTHFVRGIPEEPVSSLREAAAGTGFIDVFAERDDAVKIALLEYRHHPSLAAALVRKAYPNLKIPHDRLLLKIAAKPRDFQMISAEALLAGQSSSRLRGKIVLVGVTATGITDRLMTSATWLGRNPGVFLHAYTITNLLEWGDLKVIPWGFGLLFTALLLALLSAMPFYRGLKVGLGLFPVVSGVAFALYARGFWLSPLHILLPIVITLGIRWLQFTLELQTEKQRSRSVLEKYLSPAVLEHLSAGTDAPMQDLKKVTVLFADLRGYTRLAERSSPGEVVAILNKLLGIMADIIIVNDGIVDKFTGDGVLAFFGGQTGDGAEAAVRTAFEIQKICHRREHELTVGIGIATGPVSVGWIGSDERHDYTIIGDTVNVAARLEKLAGKGGILADEVTVRAAGLDGDPLALRLKGRKDPVAVVRLAAGGEKRFQSKEGGRFE